MRISILFILCLLNSVYSLNNLQIHIFDVGQAMSQLWVYPNGYSVFIDCPEHNWNKDEVANKLATKLYNILNMKHINVGVISHLHLDHLGTAGYGGFWALIEKYGFTQAAPYRGELETLYPEAPAALAALSEKYVLGVIANQAKGLKERLREWGILPYFTAVASSWEA